MSLTAAQTTDEICINDTFATINNLADNGKLHAALKICEELSVVFPNHPRILHALGMLRYRTGEFEVGELLIREALQLKPDYADALQNLGVIVSGMLRFSEAEQLYRQVLKLTPENHKAMALLALVLITKGQTKEASELCAQSMQLCPANELNYLNMGNLMLAFGQPDQAYTYFNQGVKLQATDALKSSLLFVMNLLPVFSQQDIYRQSVQLVQKFADTSKRQKGGYLNSVQEKRKIRIGYVSGDFKLHPVAYYLKPVLANHDKEVFGIYLYNTFPLQDEVTDLLSSYAVVMRDISSVSDIQAEKLIRCDCIDILVDLAGHTGFNRLGLFALKPAPVQVSWLGYFNTTGLKAIDYLISDPITIPLEDDCFFSEKIIRLPICRFCYEPMPYTPPTTAGPALKNGYITFGSFNSIHKITFQVLATWSKILHAVSNSKLLLKSKSFSDDVVVDDFINRFKKYGISPDRIIFKKLSSHYEMLQEYGEIDIALDPFPYNGGATTCEALWMGVPVVTLEMGTPISRQSKAFLHAIHHQELVASTIDDYVLIAQKLALKPNQLALMRRNLRREMACSPLCDGPSFAKNIETVYKEIWETWRKDRLLPDTFKCFSPEELYSSGAVVLNDGDPEYAVLLLTEVLRHEAGHYEAINLLAEAYKKLGMLEKSLSMYRSGIRRYPHRYESYLGLGVLYVETTRYRQARKQLTAVLKLCPDNIQALVNLGIANRMLDRIHDSVVCCERVLELSPEHLGALGNLALAQGAMGDISKAVQTLKRGVEISPFNYEMLTTLMSFLFYDVAAKQSDVFELSRQVADVLELDAEPWSLCSPREEKKLLRVGFVSPDFCHHPVGILLLALFQNYNSERLSLFCYSNGSRHDQITYSYQEKADTWRDITAISDQDAAEIIRNDKIDILIDLTGHTVRNRIQIFCFRPAPIQITWMGYGHTTGLDSIDYIIADNDFIQPQDEQWFVERVVRLPYSRFCFVQPSPSPEVVESPCLDSEYITFGSFNNPLKISENVIEVWSSIMRRVPKSRLVLKFSTFKDVSVRRRFRELFSTYGISPRRIEFRTFSSPYLMLMEHGDIDIMLDTFPFTGGMTSLNALWMGVPIITLAGTTPISRQTKTFLDLLGFHELVTTNKDEYIETAVKLSFDFEKLQLFRDSLRSALLNSPLCDGRRFAQDVEMLLFQLWGGGEQNSQQAIEYAQLCAQQGNFTRERNNPLSSQKLLKKAIALDKNNFIAHNSLGLVYSSLGQLGKAFKCFDKALEIENRYAEAWNNKASLQMVCGNMAEANKSYDKAYALQPERLHIRSNQLLFMNYIPTVTQEEYYTRSIAWKQYVGWQAIACDYNNLLVSDTVGPEKLRIGFVSPDFRKHSVAYFLGPLFSHLDKKKYEIVCFSDVIKNDLVTNRLQSYADEWHEVFGVAHQELFEVINNNQVHILFDLAGHTSRNRLEVFAAKPSPIQVSWLGYPNTTGLTEIDYRFTDDIADPVDGNDKWYAEKLVRLSEGFLCYEPPKNTPNVTDFPCIKKGCVTFGSFNNISKTSPYVIEAWAAILNRVEGSVIMLKNWFFSDQSIQQKFYDGFAAFGVTSDRIILLPAASDIKEHLCMYQHVDIALDTFPYNGTTTTCEALWMGVPVVTFTGDRHAGRVGASILNRIGLSELVARDRNDYIDRAVMLAENICQRPNFRQSIRECFINSSLFNGELFTRSFESALDKIWSDYKCSK